MFSNMGDICKIFQKMADSSKLILSLNLPLDHQATSAVQEGYSKPLRGQPNVEFQPIVVLSQLQSIQ